MKRKKGEEVLQIGSTRDDGWMGWWERKQRRFDGSSGDKSEQNKDRGKKRRDHDMRKKNRIRIKKHRKKCMTEIRKIKRKMNVKGASMNDTHLTGITCMEGEG